LFISQLQLDQLYRKVVVTSAYLPVSSWTRAIDRLCFKQAR